MITGSVGSWSDGYYYVPLENQLKSIYSKTPKTVVSGSIPTKESHGEIRTRKFLETTFQKPFKKIRPDFLVNQVTGSKYNLEFDCYNEQLKLAVEYNGSQHYNYIPFFHKNKEAYYNQKYRDELKRLKCKELGITLVEIPYTEEKHLETYLYKQLQLNGFL